MEHRKNEDTFYPDLIPHSRNHPHKTGFRIIETGDDRGRAMIALKGFPLNGEIARLSGVLVPDASLNTIQIGPGLHMCDPWFCRFLLHSCDPNGRIDLATLTLTARKPIARGDLLSIDYGLTEDRLGQQFECHCGADNCRHWMMGQKEFPDEDGKRVLAKFGL